MNDQIISFLDNTLPRMGGWCTREKAVSLIEMIYREKPHVVVEIGVFSGRSLIPQALALKAVYGDKADGKVYGIDPWKKDAALEGEVGPENAKWWSELDLHQIHKECIESVWNNGVDEHCVLIRSESYRCVTLFNFIDLLHIDGNHSELSSCRDVELYVPKVRSGGFIYFDDCDWATTQKALKIMETMATKVGEVGSCNIYLKV